MNKQWIDAMNEAGRRFNEEHEKPPTPAEGGAASPYVEPPKLTASERGKARHEAAAKRPAGKPVGGNATMRLGLSDRSAHSGNHSPMRGRKL